MHCTLLIPGLFWPQETAPAVLRDLDLSALTKLLARSTPQHFAAITPEGWLCQAFEVARQHDWPLAPLTLEIDGGVAGHAYWLRADPVHIKVERNRLTVVESSSFDLTKAEADALVHALTGQFAADGMTFVAHAAKRWYLKLSSVPNIVTRALSEVAGRDVRGLLPTGSEAMAWHRMFNESQMLLHDHPVNAAREERGEAAVNSVWFWGGGTRPPVPGRAFSHVWSHDASAHALGAAADAEAAALPADAAALLRSAGASGTTSHLVVLDGLDRAAAFQDADTWRERLAAFEARWFAPLVDALQSGRIKGVAVVVPGADACCRFDASRADLYKVWRRAKPLSAYA
jgi:hypothetical protein